MNLKIFDLLGREVLTLVNQEQKAENYKVTFNASRFASGIYFYKLSANSGTSNFSSVKKMILLR